MTTDTEPQFLTVGAAADAREIAYLITPAAAVGGTGLIWLPGLKSDMVSTKASALDAWCRSRGNGLTRFEYSGHGSSGGNFEDATIGDWLGETRAVFDQLTKGPQILVGSSTGGHIALLLLRELQRIDPEAAARVKGLVLIAPAWDLTEELMWKKFPENARRELMENGVYRQPSDYGEPYAITKNFIEEGRNHLIGREGFDPGCPIIILQGVKDDAVPVEHARELAAMIQGGWAELLEVSDGEHRMSRPQDLALMFSVIDKLIERAGKQT